MHSISVPFLQLMVRFLLAVMLVTVLSPGFGWAAVEGSLPHEHAVHAHADAASVGVHDHCDADEPVADSAQHCCPGHVLGHLLAGLGGEISWLPKREAMRAVDRDNSRFSTRIPEGLERPPRAAA